MLVNAKTTLLSPGVPTGGIGTFRSKDAPWVAGFHRAKSLHLSG